MQHLALESMRGLAAVMVALIHVRFVVDTYPPLIEQAAIFVDFFFVLSGFVMTLAYASKIDAGFRFTDFALLRFGRLYPLHVVMLLAWLPYILAKGYAHHQLGLGGDPFEKNNLVTFFTNFFLINGMGLTDVLSWNYPAWSISVEFFAYLVFFGFVFATSSKRSPLSYLGVSALAYVVLWSVTDRSLLDAEQFGFPRCIGGFFLGAFVCAASRARQVSVGARIGTLLELVALGVLFALVLHSRDNKLMQLASFASFAATIWVFTIQEDGLMSRMLKLRPFVAVGALSYSIYMTHALVFISADNLAEYVLGMDPTTLVGHDGAQTKVFRTSYAPLINTALLLVVIGVSLATYRYVEKPWRARVRRWVAER